MRLLRLARVPQAGLDLSATRAPMAISAAMRRHVLRVLHIVSPVKAVRPTAQAARPLGHRSYKTARVFRRVQDPFRSLREPIAWLRVRVVLV